MGIREWYTARRDKPRAQPARVLTEEQRASWEANGFLALRGFISPGEIAAVRAAVDDEWQRRPGNDHEVDVNSGPLAGRAYKMHSVDPSARGECYKLNNLFGRRADIRAVSPDSHNYR